MGLSGSQHRFYLQIQGLCDSKDFHKRKWGQKGVPGSPFRFCLRSLPPSIPEPSFPVSAGCGVSYGRVCAVFGREGLESPEHCGNQSELRVAAHRAAALSLRPGEAVTGSRDLY